MSLLLNGLMKKIMKLLEEGLFDIHLKSAIKKANDDTCLLMMTSITREDLERQYIKDKRSMNHLSSIIEASEEMRVNLCIEESDSIIKIASWLKWKKLSFCVLTGNSLIYDIAQKQGFETFYLKDSEKVSAKLKD